MRIGRAEIEANPDGISLGGPLMETHSGVSRDGVSRGRRRSGQRNIQVDTGHLQTIVFRHAGFFLVGDKDQHEAITDRRRSCLGKGAPLSDKPGLGYAAR